MLTLHSTKQFLREITPVTQTGRYALLLLLCLSGKGKAQTGLPFITATNKQAYIIEDNADTTGWFLTPEAKPDVYTVTKSPKPRRITLLTDKGRYSVKLKAGTSHDFMVILNGKDTCYTRFVCLPLKNDKTISPPVHDTIPFVLTAYNNIKCKVLLNTSDTLYLKFDSGSTGFRITKEKLKQLQLASLHGHTVSMSKSRWDNVFIHPVALSGQETDGRFGWDVLDGKIIEIDYDRQWFIIHTQLPHIPKGYKKQQLIYKSGLLVFKAQFIVKGQSYKDLFLFDSGYQRSIMLDKALSSKDHFPVNTLPVINKTMVRNGAGDTIPLITVKNDLFRMGSVSIRNIPLQVLSGPNPSGMQVHIMGNDLLKRFSTIFDFQNHVVYLKPNHLLSYDFAQN